MSVNEVVETFATDTPSRKTSYSTTGDPEYSAGLAHDNEIVEVVADVASGAAGRLGAAGKEV